MRREQTDPKAAIARFSIAKRLVPFVLAVALLVSTAACSAASSTESSGVTTAIVGAAPTAEESDIAVVDSLVNRYYEGKELECPEAREYEQITCSKPIATETEFYLLFSKTISYNPDDPNNLDKYVSESYLWSYDKNGNVLAKTDIFVKEDIKVRDGYCLVEDPEGGFTGLFRAGETRTVFVFFDDGGKQRGDAVYLDLLDDVSRPFSMQFAANGNILVGDYGKIWEFTREGELVRAILSNSIWGKLLSVNGSVYVEGGAEIGAYMMEEAMYKVPEEGDSLGDPEKFRIPDLDYFSCEGALYSQNSECLYRYNTQTETIEPQIYWNMTDLILPNSYGSTIPVSENQYLCQQTQYNTNRLTLTLLTRQPEDYLANRTVLTVAGVGIGGDDDLLRAIVEFNRESPSYRIEVMDYLIRFTDYLNVESAEDYQDNITAMQRQIKLEIMAGNGPDMLLPSPDDDLSFYADSDLLVDLQSFIDQDSSFDESECVQSVWNAAKKDGKLYEMPICFVLKGLSGSKERIGDRTGWTFAEFNEVASRLPEGGRCFNEFTRQSELLLDALPYSLQSYVNTETGEVKFESEEFGALLDFAKTYGTPDGMFDEFGVPINNAIISDMDPIDRILSGEVLFSENTCISDPWMYGDTCRLFGKAGVSFCGYPSAESAGPIAWITQSIAIVDKQEVSEGCWQFARTLLSEANQRRYTVFEISGSYCAFPMRESLLAEYLEIAQDGINPLYSYDYYYMGKDTEPVTEMQTLELSTAINNIVLLESKNQEIQDIILEEAAPFFADQKSREEVMANIQNRVQTLVLEDM